MGKLIREHKLTIKAALLLDAFIVSLAMGFAVSATFTFFGSHVDKVLVSTMQIGVTVAGLLFSMICQSQRALKTVLDHFIPFVIVVDTIYLTLALIGETHVEVRFIGYQLMGVFGAGLLSVNRKMNVAAAYMSAAAHGATAASQTSFSAKCEMAGMLGHLFGAVAAILGVLLYGDISVTFAMVFESVGCMFAHWLQVFINKRVTEEFGDFKFTKTKKDGEPMSDIDPLDR